MILAALLVRSAREDASLGKLLAAEAEAPIAVRLLLVDHRRSQTTIGRHPVLPLLRVAALRGPVAPGNPLAGRAGALWLCVAQRKGFAPLTGLKQAFLGRLNRFKVFANLEPAPASANSTLCLQTHPSISIMVRHGSAAGRRPASEDVAASARAAALHARKECAAGKRRLRPQWRGAGLCTRCAARDPVRGEGD